MGSHSLLQESAEVRVIEVALVSDSGTAAGTPW